MFENSSRLSDALVECLMICDKKPSLVALQNLKNFFRAVPEVQDPPEWLEDENFQKIEVYFYNEEFVVIWKELGFGIKTFGISNGEVVPYYKKPNVKVWFFSDYVELENFYDDMICVKNMDEACKEIYHLVEERQKLEVKIREDHYGYIDPIGFIEAADYMQKLITTGIDDYSTFEVQSVLFFTTQKFNAICKSSEELNYVKTHLELDNSDEGFEFIDALHKLEIFFFHTKIDYRPGNGGLVSGIDIGNTSMKELFEIVFKMTSKIAKFYREDKEFQENIWEYEEKIFQEKQDRLYFSDTSNFNESDSMDDDELFGYSNDLNLDPWTANGMD